VVIWSRPDWWCADRRSDNVIAADLIAWLGNAVDILAWLRELGLERYERAFRENEIAADILPKLTADDLKDIGVTIVGHRRKLLEAIAALARPALAQHAGSGAPRPHPRRGLLQPSGGS